MISQRMVTCAVVLPADLRARVEARAMAERRSLSNYLRNLIEERLEELVVRRRGQKLNASKAGKARWKGVSKEARRKLMQAAADARWRAPAGLARAEHKVRRRSSRA